MLYGEPGIVDHTARWDGPIPAVSVAGGFLGMPVKDDPDVLKDTCSVRPTMG
jgi:hypothetical protein